MPVPHLSAAHLLAAGGYQLGHGRLVPSVFAVLGLLSVVVGALALTRRTTRRGWTAAAAVAGLVSAAAGGLHAANAAGGLGTGHGLAGAVVAVALGLIGAVIAGLALTRARRP
ncbi:DUF6223 family protein [Micromonospora zhanjiangensis]|uniref:DUF6223 family protein n=1 Tax=Micromonospora zhanjiangensis TaxID=1522057 RepID=A0ABV8KV17_9ACTN